MLFLRFIKIYKKIEKLIYRQEISENRIIKNKSLYYLNKIYK